MGFFFNTKGSIISDAFKLTEKHGHLVEGFMYDVALYDDHLSIKIPLAKNETTLQYSQITDVEYGLTSEIVEKNKSVIGRALTGGILLGGVGAVVGAVSGVGKKQTKERHFYFIINYKSSDGEEKFLAFEDVRLYKGQKVANKLKELCGITNNAVSGNTAL